jgi:hypothetical protein
VQQPSAVSGFFSSLSSFFSFSPQRALGYAALMVVLAFGVISVWLSLGVPRLLSQLMIHRWQ